MSASLVSNNINEQLNLYFRKTNDPLVYAEYSLHIPTTNSTYRYYIPFNYFKKDTLQFSFSLGASNSNATLNAGFIQPDGTTNSLLSVNINDIKTIQTISHSFEKGIFYSQNGTLIFQSYNMQSFPPFSTPFLEFQNITSSSNVVLTCNSLVDLDDSLAL